jgi:hypothetical protein
LHQTDNNNNNIGTETKFFAAEYKEQTPNTKMFHLHNFDKIFEKTRISQSPNPLFYYYTGFNARLSNQGKLGHVFPCKLIAIPNTPEKVIEQVGEEVIALQIFRTRCSAPRLDLACYDPTTNKIIWHQRCTNIFRYYYCDTLFDMDNSEYIKIIQVFIDYIIETGLYYDPSRGIMPDSKFFNSKTFYSADNNDDVDDDVNIDAQNLAKRRSKVSTVNTISTSTTITTNEDSEVTNPSKNKNKVVKNVLSNGVDKSLTKLEKQKKKIWKI